MHLSQFSKQEQRGLLLIVLLLLVIVGVLVWQTKKTVSTENINSSAQEEFYKGIQINQIAVDNQFDTLTKKQKESSIKVRKNKKSVEKSKKEYPQRNPYEDVIPIE